MKLEWIFIFILIIGSLQNNEEWPIYQHDPHSLLIPQKIKLSLFSVDISPKNSVACTMLIGRTSSVNFLISGSFAHVQISARNELPTIRMVV